MKTVYINENGEITKRKIRKIVKKINKIIKKEQVIIAICKNLCENEELLNELEDNKIQILNRKMAF